jgi:pimeloyl-ACP methyl ester carboxylesterase
MTISDNPVIERYWQEQLRLSYLRAGVSGPNLVLLHGWGAFKELWWSAMLALAPNYRAFALDLPGHGESPQSNARDMLGVARLVADFCAAEGLSSITLIGHSMGGNIALELTLARPDLVTRLVLVDAAIDAHLLPAYVQPYASDTYGWTALRLSQAFARHFRGLGAGVPHVHGGGWLRPWFRRSAYTASHDPVALRQLLRGLFANPLGPRAEQVHVPTLVVSGQFDSLVPPAHSRRIAATISGAQYVEISGALHNPMDERPLAFERSLLQFLQATDTRQMPEPHIDSR